MRTQTTLGTRTRVEAVLLGGMALAVGFGCSGPSPTVDAGTDAGVDAGRDAGPPPPLPVPARGACPEGYEPGCVAGFALCGEEGSCPEGQVCSLGLCRVETDEPVESCRLPNDGFTVFSPGCPSGRACLVFDEGPHPPRIGLCVPREVCEAPPEGYSCRFYDGSPYDDSAWSGECPPSFPDYPYCGGICGEDACPRDPVTSWLATRGLMYPVAQSCLGVTGSRPFGVCVSPVEGRWVADYYQGYYGDRGEQEVGPFAVLEFQELPGKYYALPVAVCLDYQSRVEGVRCVDSVGNPL